VLLLPKIPLIEELTTEPVPAGSTILVEFAGASQWYSASLSIVAGWLKSGGRVSYNMFAQPPDDIRRKLNRLGLNASELEKEDKLRILDWYTATLGQRSKERHKMDSLKVPDLSILFSSEVMHEPLQPDWMRMADNMSMLARFNDEKSWVEFILTRVFPSHRLRKSTAIVGYAKGIHSGWVYEQLEGAVDGIVDFKLEEVSGEMVNFMRIRSMRETGFESRWHPLKIGENFEVTLDK
jgi:KaiC/GvpD/RAD55 family RecA-like ATPase